MATTDSQEPATKQFRVRVREGSPIVTSNVEDNGDMEAGVYEVQEEDLLLKGITNATKTTRPKPASATSPPATKSRLGYYPDLNPLLPPPKQQRPVERGGLAPLYGLSRTTKSPSQPKSPQHQLQSNDLSDPLGAN